MALIGTRTGQTLRAKDPNDRPVIDNSASPNLVVWELKYYKQRFHGANLINLELVNTKIVADIPEVKVHGVEAPTFDMHTCRLALARSLRCACPAHGSDQGMQV